MSTQQTVDVPDSISLRNRNDDSWHEYDGEPLFTENGLEHVERRFGQMNDRDWEFSTSARGSNTQRTKIRTKDQQSFAEDVTQVIDSLRDEHGEFVTRIGNVAYCDPVTDLEVIGIDEKGPRKTQVKAAYNVGRSAGIGGAKYKRQKILLGIRDFEQWLIHTNVVETVFPEYHEKYPY